MGVGARDWEDVAKKDHLSELQAALQELESQLNGVYRQMLAMRTREEQMRDLSESVNSRVAWAAAASLGVSCTLSLWQLFALKRFFRKKKLI